MAKKVTPRLAKSEVPGVFQMQYQKQSDAHAIYQNGNALSYYRNRLRDLALVRYVYDFGDSVPLLESSRLNLMLYNYKELAIARADSGDLVMLPYTLTDIKTIYGYPSHVRIYSPYTTFHIERDYEEIALIRDNISSYSTASIVEYFATSLYIIDRTISVNLYNQKTPVLIVAENDAPLRQPAILPATICRCFRSTRPFSQISSTTLSCGPGKKPFPRLAFPPRKERRSEASRES